jgi:hypothetical protein
MLQCLEHNLPPSSSTTTSSSSSNTCRAEELRAVVLFASDNDQEAAELRKKGFRVHGLVLFASEREN